MVPIGSKLADLDWSFDAYFPVNTVNSYVQWDDGTSSRDSVSYGIVYATKRPQGSLQHQYSTTGAKEVWYEADGYMELYTLYWFTAPFADADVVY